MSLYADDFSHGSALETLSEPQEGKARRPATLSASGISTFLRCPEAYRQSYVLGNWGPGSAATTLGKAYHSTLQKNYEQKVFSFHDLDAFHIARAYDEGWREAMREKIKWGKTEPEVIYRLGLKLAHSYITTVAVNVQPIAVEERFSIEVGGANLIGVIDVRDLSNTIIDTKTSGKVVYEPQPQWRMQAYCYLAAHPAYNFEWHVHVKDKNQIITANENGKMMLRNTRARSEAGRRMVEHTWTSLNDLWERIGPYEPWPGHGQASYACPSCDFKPKCFWWV